MFKKASLHVVFSALLLTLSACDSTSLDNSTLENTTLADDIVDGVETLADLLSILFDDDDLVDTETSPVNEPVDDTPASVPEPVPVPEVQEPVTVPVVEEPVTVPVVEEPVTVPVVEEPVVVPEVEEPVVVPEVEEPIVVPEVEEPVVVPEVEEPVVVPEVEEPVVVPEVEEPETVPVVEGTDQPAVDEFGVYDIARYVLPAKGGYYKWDGYLEEQGSLTSTGTRHEVTLPDREEGVWINNNIGPISGMTLDYNVGDELIDVRLKSSILPSTLELQLYRFAKIGDDIVVPPAPFDAKVTLNRHSDSYDTVVAGQVIRTDSDVLELLGDIAILNIKTKLSVYVSRDLGGVAGIDKDCVVSGFFSDGVDDSLPDSSCDKVTIDYGVLEPQTIRQ